ncbi:MAG: 4Fe-4S dicluster domain-containing protein, partial [Bacteroidaceae bacterium]|nr:4Fe-4S dicluster domain-containing protein [Bacteroidaceae bacterium]
NGAKVNWALDYDSLSENIIKILIEKKIKEINLFDSRFVEELGLLKILKNEEIQINLQSNNCVIFEPTYAISQTGSLYMVFNSAIEMEQVLSAKMKIFVLPVNNVLKNIEDVELLSKLYSINKNREEYLPLTAFYSVKENDENNVELFIIDNGRTNLLESKEHRKALTCINCDACKKVCPIYSLIGDMPYNNVFTGPIANVVLPFLETIDGYKHLSFNCILCGNCAKVCPMNIPITYLIIANRNMFYENKNIDLPDRYRINILKKNLISRKKLNRAAWRKEFLMKLYVKRKITVKRPMPKFAKISFSKSQNQ